MSPLLLSRLATLLNQHGKELPAKSRAVIIIWLADRFSSPRPLLAACTFDACINICILRERKHVVTRHRMMIGKSPSAAIAPSTHPVTGSSRGRATRSRLTGPVRGRRRCRLRISLAGRRDGTARPPRY